MTLATYQLCKHPDKMARVKAEIKELWPNLHGPMPKAAQFEKLPYLVRAVFQHGSQMRNDLRLLFNILQTAVIKESLRMAPTTTSENSRLVPEKGAKIGEDFIPGNVGALWPRSTPVL